MYTFLTERTPPPASTAQRKRPRAPRTPQETGLPFQFLVEMVAKVLFTRGQARLTELCSHLCLSVGVIDPIIIFMRGEKLCESTRRGASGTDGDLSYGLTDAGLTRAVQYGERNSYAGPAPVTLADYCSQVEAHSVGKMHITRDDVARIFTDVVVNPKVLEQIGAGMNSRRALYVHGPAGSGKTYLAERLSGLLNGSILVPHAVMIEGEVMQLFDPMVHRPIGPMLAAVGGIEKATLEDTRWVECARPTVLTGGELTLDMLDLQFDSGTRFYQSPSHLKANNGIFIIDDLGRQRCSPVELMNRWIVPLDRRLDFLSLHTGHKFMVPFDVIVVFSSNLHPKELLDTSFLRRLGYKIHVGALSEDAYRLVFEHTCADLGLPYRDEMVDYLLQEHHYTKNRELLACYPRDLLAQVRDRARFEEIGATLGRRDIDWAWHNYFGDNDGETTAGIAFAAGDSS